MLLSLFFFAFYEYIVVLVRFFFFVAHNENNCEACFVVNGILSLSVLILDIGAV